MRFDPDRDRANLAERGRSLVEGEDVPNDPLGLTVEDDSSGSEHREVTVGMNATGEVWVVVWSERDDGERSQTSTTKSSLRSKLSLRGLAQSLRRLLVRH